MLDNSVFLPVRDLCLRRDVIYVGARAVALRPPLLYQHLTVAAINVHRHCAIDAIHRKPHTLCRVSYASVTDPG